VPRSCHFDQREKSFFLYVAPKIMPAENRYFVYFLTNWNHRVMVEMTRKGAVT